MNGEYSIFNRSHLTENLSTSPLHWLDFQDISGLVLFQPRPHESAYVVAT